MKKILLAFILPIFFVQGFAQLYTSSCSHTDAMVNIYRNDVYKLAVSRVQLIQSNYKDSIEIPAVFLDSIANALYAVYNMPETSFKDSVMNLFGFSDFSTNPYFHPQYEYDSSHIIGAGFVNNYMLKNFEIDVYNNSSFADAWSQGNYSNTVNDTINSLVSGYEIQVTKEALVYQIIPGETRYDVRLPRTLNIPALTSTFSNISGIGFCQPLNYIGDGNYISTEFMSDGIILNYRNGCGDCPAGCTSQTIWKFKVYLSDCSVEYLSPGEHGGCFRGEVMPLSLVSFIISLKNNQAVLQWKTTREANSNYFSIERSADGINFNAIGKTAAAGNSTSVKQYSFIDASSPTLLLAEKGVFYRLKEVDKDGKFTYSKIISVKLPQQQAAISINPNPATDRIFVSSSTLVQKIEIINPQGVVVMVKNEVNLSNPLFIGNLSKGIYFLKAYTAGGVVMKEFMKQ